MGSGHEQGLALGKAERQAQIAQLMRGGESHWGVREQGAVLTTL